jgi:predicted RNase H-like HicB family nuclease
MKYLYTAVFTTENDKVMASVPDLPGCISSGKTLFDAISMIQDAASAWLVTAEDEGIAINPPTEQSKLKKGKNDILSVISIDTIDYRAKTETRAVRKNVSLPAWMAKLVEKKGINCSQVLQESLLKEFKA